MRRLLQAVLAAGLCAASSASAQTTDNAPVVSALPQGPLTVWIVTQGTAADRARIAYQNAQKRAVAFGGAPGYNEQTVANFGTASSNVGQTAGSAGTTAGSFGTASGNVGQTAGSYGQPSGNSGKNASDSGQTAGSYGQTVASFGQTAGSYGSSLNGAPLTPPAPAREPTPDEREVTSASFFHGMNVPFPRADVKYLSVMDLELKDKLAAAEGSKDYPDIVLGKPLPGWWDQSGLGLAMLGTPSFLDVADESSHSPIWLAIKAGILVRALHPVQARTFVEWLRDQNGCGICGWTASHEALTNPAKAALEDVLNGNDLGSLADPEAAKFSAEMARRIALAPPTLDIINGLKFRIDVTGVDGNDQLGVVSLRAIASSPQAFGVLHALVVLRNNGAAGWKVLQISPNLAVGSMEGSWGLLRPYTNTATAAKVVSISEAAPLDGDNRPPQPDLWWDNKGDAGLLCVEWQIKLGSWTDSRMLLVPESRSHVQTRVKATFARTPGEYRWRVWSVGYGGTTALSPWRSLNIVP
jgi:hypothetical protein